MSYPLRWPTRTPEFGFKIKPYLLNDGYYCYADYTAPFDSTGEERESLEAFR